MAETNLLLNEINIKHAINRVARFVDQQTLSKANASRRALLEHSSKF